MGGAQLLGISDYPCLIPVNGSLELLKGEDGLSKGLDDGDASDILHRLIGHIIQGVLVFLHFLLHPGAGHGHHDEKAQQDRCQTQEPQPPVKDEQQHQQATGGGDGARPVGELVGQVGLRCRAGLVDDLPQLAAADALGKSKRELDNVLHRLNAQVGSNAEGAQMRTHEPRNVDQYRNHREQYRHPAVVGQVPGATESRCGFQHLLHHQPDIIVGHQRDQGAHSRQYP